MYTKDGPRLLSHADVMGGAVGATTPLGSWSKPQPFNFETRDQINCYKRSAKKVGCFRLAAVSFPLVSCLTTFFFPYPSSRNLI